MQDPVVRRDFGLTWKERLAQARERAARPGAQLSDTDIAALRSAVQTLDVTSPADQALLWSGRDVPTGVRMDESDAASERWQDKLACYEAEVFRKLGIGFTVEDTPGGAFLVAARLHYAEGDPLHAVARHLWEVLSRRFVQAARGRIEIIAEGALQDSVFRLFEFEALLANPAITTVNGLDKQRLRDGSDDALALLRRWDVERGRRYAAFITADADATAYERETAIDDFREVQLWYEQDFFERLTPARELPPLPAALAEATDASQAAQGWKYAPAWRRFIRQTGERKGAAP